MPSGVVMDNNFTAGMLSELLEARGELPRYQNGARRLSNWLVLTQGGVQRRPGQPFIAEAKFSESVARLEPFVFSAFDALQMEFGDFYVRVYATVPPYALLADVGTPYAASQVFDLTFKQIDNVVYICHTAHDPRKLLRLPGNSWELRLVTFRPPPSFEAGVAPATTLTLSAVTGIGITGTADAATFLETEVDRQISSGIGRGVITEVTSPTIIVLNVLEDFSATALLSGTWTIEGSPVATLTPDRDGPVGARITLDLGKIQENEPELITNGGFDSDLTGWTDLSGAIVAEGAITETGVRIEDTTDGDFLRDGVLPGQRALNLTALFEEQVVEALDAFNVSVTGTGTWTLADDYEIRQTGTIKHVEGKAALNGGIGGIAWFEQGFPTVVDTFYRSLIDVSDQPLSYQVGSASKQSDIQSEVLVSLQNEREFIFQATTTTTYLQVRNNQNVIGMLDNVSVKKYSADGFGSSDLGKFVKVHGGVVKLTEFVNPTKMRGDILKTLRSDEASAAWSLEDVSWSTSLGFPQAVATFEQRLHFQSTDTFPRRFWESQTGDANLEKFGLGSLASDSLEYALVDARGRLPWVISADQLLIGAENGVFRATGAEFAALTPTNAVVRPQNAFGSKKVQPVKVGTVIIFVQLDGSAVREMVIGANEATSEPRDIMLLSGLLQNRNIVQMVYQPRPLSCVWSVLDDGALLGLTRDRNEEVLGWHPHATQGAYESVSVIPDPASNGHQIWFLVRRTINGTTKRFLEKSDIAPGVIGEAYLDCLAFDAGVREDGAPSTILTGLDHLEGETVGLRGDRAIYPDQVVSGGQVVFSQAVAARQAGLKFEAEGETLRPEIALVGSIQQSPKHYGRLTARLLDTIGLTLQGQTMDFRTPAMPMDTGVEAFTGDKEISNLGWGKEGTVTFAQTQALPAILLGIIGRLNVGEQAGGSRNAPSG